MRTALADIAHTAETLIHLAPGDSVLDIGCNDGTLLASYATEGIYKVGVDPAQNLAPLSRKVADQVIVGFFSADAFQTSPELRDRRPKVVTSIAMFYDLEEPRRFVADVKSVMDPNGLWIVQMSYLPLMLRDHEIGNICHEHLEYYSLQSFEYLLALHDMKIVDVELNDVNGGSLRAYIRNADADPAGFADPTYRELADARVQQLREDEQKLGLDRIEPYTEFAVVRADQERRGRLHPRADVARQEGLRLRSVDEGQHGPSILRTRFNADHRGRGAQQGQVGAADGWHAYPDRVGGGGAASEPDFFLVLPWHFLREFQEREKPYLMAGGRFILPAPHFMLL
jgi:SAM-dependent methyltransferase